MTRHEIIKGLKRWSPWFHKIDLGDGIITPGHDWDYLWDNIRSARESVSYHNKSVLDLGTSEGLWAFEAEKLGASRVVGIDNSSTSMERLLFCREVLRSSIEPFLNINVQTLVEQARSQLGKFDIVQHLGLFYHLPDPLISLRQARGMVADDGVLLFETAAVTNVSFSCMVFNGVKPDVEVDYYWWRGYSNPHPQWFPSLPCVNELLLSAAFEPMLETLSVVEQPETAAINQDDPAMVYRRARVALVARALPVTGVVDRTIYEKILKPKHL